MNKAYRQGFTLIEIIVVVVIVSIMTVLGVQMVSSGSVERNLQQHGRILQAAIEYSCDQATLQNIPYGVKFFKNGYAFTQFINQQWVTIISEDSFYDKELVDGSFFSLAIDDQSVILNDEVGDIPQIMCNSSGELTAFELLISDASDKHHYQLKTIDFWQIEGHWLNDSKS